MQPPWSPPPGGPGQPGGYGPPPNAPGGFTPPPGPAGGWGTGLPPGVQGPPGGYGQGGYGTQTEPMGIISLVLGVISLPMYFCCSIFSVAFNIVGLVLGFVSLSRIKSDPGRYGNNKGLAIGGLVINGLFLLGNVVLMVFVFGMMGIGMLSGP